MRHADGGEAGFPLGPPGSARWRGWTGPARRLREAASLALVGAILTLGGAATQAHTGATVLPEADPSEPGGGVRPIAGWTEFCRRRPADCGVDPAEAASVTLTPAAWRTLESVNRRVNRRIRPITDQAHWGVLDRWDYPDDGSGDCEDYQLLKRRMLAERGLPRRALLMTVVVDETEAGHAVLTVRTDRGDLVLDNRTDAIRPWNRTGYAFIKRQGQDGPDWVSLEDRAGQDRAGQDRDGQDRDGQGRDKGGRGRGGARVAAAQP